MGNENSNNRRDRRCRSCSEIHDGNCRPNIRCFKCGERGHTSRYCDIVIVPNIEGCNHCGGKHASSNCRQFLRKNAEEEQKKLELEKKVEKLEGQVDKMLKLSEEDKKNGEASPKNRKDNSETNNNPYKNSATQLDPHNMKPADFAGTPLQFNRPPPLIQMPAFSQSQNNPLFNQTQNQPFPNVFPNNFPGPVMNPPLPLIPNIVQPYPNVQQSFQQPNPNVQSTHGYNQQQHSFPNNQNFQPKFNNKADSQHMSDQTAQFNQPLQNQPNQFNQKKNLPEVNVNQQRGGRSGFNRGRGGNRGGWKNHYDNNWRDNNNGNRNVNNKGRGRYFRGNYNKEPQLFAGGKPNQTKTNNAKGYEPDNEKTQTERQEADTNDFRPNRNHQEVLREGIHKERKEADANDFRPNRNYQGVLRGGIHKERVNIKGRGPPKVPRTNKNDSNSNCDSDSTGTSLETAPNTSEHKIKKRANRHKKERKESSNDSAENTGDKKLEEVDKKNKENQPLSKNNLGEGDILMKYIGTNLPKITDAIVDNVSLYRKVEGVMLMSDPTSDEPILEPAKNLLHIIEFKSLHPKAKSFFC